MIENGQLHTGLLSPPCKGPERLSWFYDEFMVLIRRYAPQVVALEGYAFGAKSQHHALGELGGVLRLALHRVEQPFIVGRAFVWPHGCPEWEPDGQPWEEYL